jgi:hypothetical protein
MDHAWMDGWIDRWMQFLKERDKRERMGNIHPYLLGMMINKIPRNLMKRLETHNIEIFTLRKKTLPPNHYIICEFSTYFLACVETLRLVLIEL